MLEIEKMLSLHPSHLTKTTDILLRHDDVPGVVSFQKKGLLGEVYGMFVYISQDWKEEDVPGDLAACIELAKKHGCDWIMFDRDVEPVPELTVLI